MAGWEPATITEYEYDADGRLVRSITTREPEFSDDDVELLTAHLANARDTGRYGESLSEATSDLADPTIYGDTAVRYVAGHHVNHAEAAVEQYREDHKADLPKHGAAFFVERVDYSERS